MDWGFKFWIIFWFTDKKQEVRIWGLWYFVRVCNWRYKLTDVASIYGIEDYFICPVNKGDIVVDIGAYIGGYAKWVENKGANVVAIEPHPSSYHYLKMNTSFKKGTYLIKKVVSSKGDVRFLNNISTLYLNERNPSEHSIVKISDWYIPRETIHLRNIIEEIYGNGNTILKMDCEGSEYDILFNSQDILDKIDRIIMEYHVPKYWGVTGYTVQDLVNLLRNHGFTVNIKQQKCYQGILYAYK
jgi:FkbM family methyltransferase